MGTGYNVERVNIWAGNIPNPNQCTNAGVAQADEDVINRNHILTVAYLPSWRESKFS